MSRTPRLPFTGAVGPAHRAFRGHSRRGSYLGIAFAKCTKVGTSVKDIEAMIPTEEAMRSALAGETHQHTVKIEDFYLMVNEVTNEQYLRRQGRRRGKLRGPHDPHRERIMINSRSTVLSLCTVIIVASAAYLMIVL